MDMEEKALPPPTALLLHTILSVGVVKERWSWAFGFRNRWLRLSSSAQARPLRHHPSPYPHAVPSSPGRSPPSGCTFAPPFASPPPFALLVRLVCVLVSCLSLCFFFFPLGFPWQPFPVSWPWEENWSLGPPLRCGPHLTLASRGYFYPE